MILSFVGAIGCIIMVIPAVIIGAIAASTGDNLRAVSPIVYVGLYVTVH